MNTFSFSQMSSRYQKRVSGRRAMAERAGVVLSSAKRAIFALHRQDKRQAAQELSTARAACTAGAKHFRVDLTEGGEGVWRAGLEEYCEAILFFEFMTRGSIKSAKLPTDDPEIVIGGLSDFTGELSRQAVLKATAHDKQAVEDMYLAVRDIIAILLKLDLTGNVRNKFDQAKRNLRHLEELRYDLSRRV